MGGVLRLDGDRNSRCYQQAPPMQGGAPFPVFVTIVAPAGHRHGRRCRFPAPLLVLPAGLVAFTDTGESRERAKPNVSRTRSRMLHGGREPIHGGPPEQGPRRADGELRSTRQARDERHRRRRRVESGRLRE